MNGHWSKYRDAWLIAISVVVAVIAVLTYDQAKNAEGIARQTAGLVQAQTIRREAICTESNQGACQALSERLFENLSAGQRKRWACDLLFYLDGAQIQRIRRAADCPRPFRPRPATGRLGP